MTAEETYRQEVEQIHAEHRARLSELHKEFFNVREQQPDGTWGRKSGFIRAEKRAEKQRNFALVRAAIRRRETLEQEGT